MTLQICPDHVIHVILDVAVRQQVVILGLVVLLLVGLKLCVQNQQPVTELLLRGRAGDKGAGVGVVLAGLLVLGARPSQVIYLGELGTSSP